MAPQRPRAHRQNPPRAAARKARPAASKQTSESWELLAPQSSSSHHSDIENEDPAGDTNQLFAMEQRDMMEDPLDTLEEMADRLGREVETFAESLDKFFDQLQPDDTYDAVYDLVLDFKGTASSRAEVLMNKYDREHRQERRREWAEQAKASKSSQRSVLTTSAHSGALSSSQPKKLKTCLTEIDTWKLFQIVLEQHYRPRDAFYDAEKQDKINKLEIVNRYTSEGAIFERFLLDDDLGQERMLVKKWLEEVADVQQAPISEIMLELQGQSKAGPGLWNGGWLHTRETIKGEKRLRTWPAPDSSPLPQLRSPETNELLVTSLDPDATSRQGRHIEEEDVYYERAMWTICWELLRRGTQWHIVCDWCETHKVAFRAALLGSSLANTDAPTYAAFRRACYLASQQECSSEYEAAVYGLLGGNLAAMQPVCRTVDDHLFAQYSADLMHQFDQYLLINYPDRIAPSLASPNDAITDPSAAQLDIFNLITKMRARPETRSQSASPLKIIQSYLLAKEPDSLIHTLGVAIGESDSIASQSNAIAPSRDPKATLAHPEIAIALDPICLRIVTHMCIVMQILREAPLSIEEQEMEDNLIVTYIHELSAAGKRDLTPLYASRLRKDCYIATMAEVLPSIAGQKEKKDVLALMLEKGMDVVAVLKRQVEDMLAAVKQETSRPKTFSILRSTDDETWPGQHIELTSFPDFATPAQEALVRSLEWFLVLEGEWEDTFHILAWALRKVLVARYFACARLIVETFRSPKVAAIKSQQIIDRTVNVLVDDGPFAANPTEAALWQDWRRLASTYVDLERLVEVFESFHHWRTQEELYTSAGRSLTAIPPDLKVAFIAVEDAMEPLLNLDGFLILAEDDNEAQDFARLRKTYMTEAIIAYNVVLHAAGCMISRDALLTSMDLATVVAAKTSGLTEVFVAAGRMKELVRSFAQVSKRILVLKNTGKPWRPKYDRKQGKDTGIWDIDSRASDLAATAETEY